MLSQQPEILPRSGLNYGSGHTGKEGRASVYFGERLETGEGSYGLAPHPSWHQGPGRQGLASAFAPCRSKATSPPDPLGEGTPGPLLPLGLRRCGATSTGAACVLVLCLHGEAPPGGRGGALRREGEDRGGRSWDSTPAGSPSAQTATSSKNELPIDLREDILLWLTWLGTLSWIPESSDRSGAGI